MLIINYPTIIAYLVQLRNGINPHAESCIVSYINRSQLLLMAYSNKNIRRILFEHGTEKNK
jgi:hypothetical protein